jgi:tRNA nucleotidyltransferase (CCA-adding enzyme)
MQEVKNIKNILENIDKDHFHLLTEIGKISKEINQKSYLVGGMVRDLLLGFDNLDIDIVVENNAALLADTLVKKFPNCELSAKHDRFHTAKVIFHINGKKIPVDLATTREETYDNEKLAPLPEVTISELKKDLIRRDFTINALAVSLLPNNFGEIVDLFNGLDDLRNKKIKILHEKSFIDDPTRMIRAIRFAAKLNFEIEEKTQAFLKEVIESKQFDNLIEKIRGDRVKIEIRYLFNLPTIENAIKIFFESGVYRMVNTELAYKEVLKNRIKKAEEILWDHLDDIAEKWIIYLGLTVCDLTNSQKESVFINLHLPSGEIKTIKDGLKAGEKLQEKNIDSIKTFQVLKNHSIESIIIAKSLTQNNLIDEYINKTSKIKLNITGQDLIKLGVPQGKQVGEILDKILELKINNPEMSKEDEEEEAKKLILDLR